MGKLTSNFPSPDLMVGHMVFSNAIMKDTKKAQTISVL